MSRETDLRKLWEKRKHSYFDENYKTYWLQIKDGDEDMNGENKETVKEGNIMHSQTEKMEEGETEVKGKNTKFTQLPAIKAFKKLENYIKPIKNSISRDKDGSFSFEIPREEFDLVEKINNLDGIPIKIERHPYRNNSRGRIFEYSTIEMTEEDILSELNPYHAKKVIKKTYYNKELKRRVYSGEVIITFDLVKLPDHIDLAWLTHLKVDQYIPKPLLCNTCYKYNNKCYDFTGDKLQNVCKSQVVKLCGWCLNKEHLDPNREDKCEKDPLCRNCEGDHPSWSKQCPEYAKELEIREIKETKKISMKRAKEIVEGKTRNKTTAASVTAKQLEDREREMNKIIEKNKMEAEERLKLAIEGNDEMWRARMEAHDEKWRAWMDTRIAQMEQRQARELEIKMQEMFKINQQPHNDWDAKLDNLAAQFTIALKSSMDSLMNQIKPNLPVQTQMTPPFTTSLQSLPLSQTLHLATGGSTGGLFPSHPSFISDPIVDQMKASLDVASENNKEDIKPNPKRHRQSVPPDIS